MIVVAVVGLVAGAALASGAWLLFGNDGASASPIAAPERLGDYVRPADARGNRNSEESGERVRRQADWDRRSGERLSEANDGAGAVVQYYTDDGLLNTFMLEAVRAPVAFPPYVPYSDPKTYGLERPFEEAREFDDDVACLLRNEPKLTYVMSCVRSTGDLTVQITHVSGDLNQDPDAVAKLVADAWEELD
jgi:hypothetical protein